MIISRKMLKEAENSVNEPTLQRWKLHSAPKITNRDAHCALSECPDKGTFLHFRKSLSTNSCWSLEEINLAYFG